MTKEQLTEKIKAMAAAPSCCAELKAATQAYFDAAGTADEKSAAKNLLAEIEEDITTVDDLVPFAHSEIAVQIFGAEGAKKFAAHAD
ncbi:MAG: heat-shock protein Hsp90 [Selenomonadaceae bacterium]|nr:heat-shock protein Hsp90 [Selenomonadaceae bacterium]